MIPPATMKPHWRISLAYLGFGIFWIVATDQFIKFLAKDSEVLTVFQTMKGGLFVLLSAALIFVLTKLAWRQQVMAEEERLAVFRKTVESAHHILLNYLNQMQLVSIEAERHRDFDRETLRIAREVTSEAAASLQKLAEIETVTIEKIDSVVHATKRPRFRRS